MWRIKSQPGMKQDLDKFLKSAKYVLLSRDPAVTPTLRR